MSWRRQICINNYRNYEDSERNLHNITIGKFYDILNFKNGNYWILDDNGNQRGIPVECFISVEEWRDNQINQILE
jgi:hypothetical protein